MSVTFREARREDLPAIVAMLADDMLGAKRERATDPLPEGYGRAFDAIAAMPGSAVLVAEAADGTVVGCLQLAVLPNLSYQGTSRALIEGVRVAAPHRGQGLGAALIRDAVERARQAGCGMVQLSTNAARKDAQRFYERLGFVASHVGMKLDLPR